MRALLIGLSLILALAGCGTSMTALGNIEQNRVYVIKHGDFLSASRMLLVLDAQGRVVASSGGTVQGGGAFATQTVVNAAGAAATVYGFHALSQAIQNASLTVKGIPDNVGVHATGTVHSTGTIDGKPATFTGTLSP